MQILDAREDAMRCPWSMESSIIRFIRFRHRAHFGRWDGELGVLSGNFVHSSCNRTRRSEFGSEFGHEEIRHFIQMVFNSWSHRFYRCKIAMGWQELVSPAFGMKKASLLPMDADVSNWSQQGHSPALSLARSAFPRRSRSLGRCHQARCVWCMGQFGLDKSNAAAENNHVLRQQRRTWQIEKRHRCGMPVDMLFGVFSLPILLENLPRIPRPDPLNVALWRRVEREIPAIWHECDPYKPVCLVSEAIVGHWWPLHHIALGCPGGIVAFVAAPIPICFWNLLADPQVIQE